MRRVLNSLIILMELFLALRLTAAAEVREPQFVVSPEQVARAISAAGVPVGAERIELLSFVQTRQPHPALKLINMGEWQEGTMKAELRCAGPGACLPFYVLVHDSPAAPDALRRQIGQTTFTFPAPKTYDVHKGDLAILVFERSESRITVRVICEQNGNRGQKIRVASRDQKRFYQAEIVEPGLLKGSL